MGQAPSGDTYNFAGEGLPLIAGAGDFNGEGLAAKKFTTKPSKVCRPGDIILSIRASIGAKVWSDNEYCLGRGVAGLRPGVQLNARFLWHWLTWSETTLSAKGKGATFMQVNRTDIAEMPVSLPPLDEQRRIAAILDKVAAMQAQGLRFLTLLDELQQACFIDVFGDPGQWDERWTMATIADLAESFQYGTSEKSGAVGEFPILRMGNVTRSGKLDLADLKYIDLDAKEFEKFGARRGDLLFNRTNSPELVGKTTVVDVDIPLVLAGYLVRVRFAAERQSIFVSAYLNSRYGKAFLRGMAKGAINQANISASELKRIPIALPSGSALEIFSVRMTEIAQHVRGLNCNCWG